MYRLLFFVFVCSLTGGHSVWGQTGKVPACTLPPALMTPSAPLAAIAAALTARNALDILALGSGSMVGPGAPAAHGPVHQTQDETFPYRMEDALRALRPEIAIHLTVKGGRDMTAATMLSVLRRELAGHHYDLVLWQTGTVEAVHGLLPEDLRVALRAGAAATNGAAADLVLIDPQFSHFLRANADLESYETVLLQMTGTPAVTLFHRFDLTQLWTTSGQIDLERASLNEREKAMAFQNDCLGQALARYVLTGAGQR